MGCNCKKTYDKMARYSDDVVLRQNKRDLSIGSGFKSILFVFTQFIFGTICAGIVIIFIVPVLIYVIVCLLFGLEPSVRIPNPYKHFRKTKD